ncbi:acyltransferase family protein [Pseudaminobacter sp. NGMCC 1.201702]|uniref:acyltransferase family protein n=1 Tax=Pseudaminobacter sp. NGMCC 1.201702 TaxID=3391825 RepID=UPI0039F02C91
MTKTADYRPDIDGLRAVAVLSVLLFHYGVTTLSGGFVGVDVFFVISGYLITKGLADDIGKNGHSIGPLLVRFYNKRIRRIVPALLVVLATTLGAGWFLLMPGDYASTGESAAYSAFGLGNLYFFWNTGYFDREAELQPLLHMWSLGVEEQFYFVWPVLLAGIIWMARSRHLVVAYSIASLMVAGFAYSVHTVATDPKAAFYLPHPRAWELGAGALLAFLPVIRNRLASEAMGIVGLGLILWSVSSLVGTEASPGWPMVPAVLGSALLVWPRAESRTARILAAPPMRFVGLISYSLYLWHWPVLVLFRHYANGEMPTPAQAAALAGISVILASLSWQFIEIPARKAPFRPLSAFGGGLSLSAAVAIASLVIVQYGGFATRISPEFEKLSSLDVMWDWSCPTSMKFGDLKAPYCVFGAPWNSASTKAILWGDSHAEHMAPVIEAATSGARSSFILYRTCPAALGERVHRIRKEDPDYPSKCVAWREAAIKFLSNSPNVNMVILSASWTNLGNVVSQDGSLPGHPDPYEMIAYGLETLINEAAAPGRRFIIIADVPQLRSDPIPCATHHLLGLLRKSCPEGGDTVSSQEFRRYQGKMYADLSEIAKRRDDVEVVLPGDHLCTGDWCQSSLGGEFLYRDASHIRRNLSEATKRDYADLIGLTEVLTRAGKDDIASN